MESSIDNSGTLATHGTHFWFQLVGLCTDAAFLCALLLAVISATSTWALALELPGHQEQAPTHGTSISGLVSDSVCRAKHKMKDKTAIECARVCVQRGAHFVLVTGDHVYVLSGRAADVDRFAGTRAKVTGTLQGTVFHVRSIAAQ